MRSEALRSAYGKKILASSSFGGYTCSMGCGVVLRLGFRMGLTTTDGTGSDERAFGL